MEITHIEHLELLAKQVVEGFIIGLHKSPFHGFSVEFAEHRLYNAGDPIKHIDWRVYGRTDRMFIKKFEEETNLRCCIVLDQSSSMLFPYDSKRPNKLQFSCLAAASILEILKRQLDAAALATFDTKIRTFSECRSSSRHYRALTNQLEALLSLQTLNQGSQIAQTLHLVAERMHQRSLIVVFTDFIDDHESAEELFSALQHLRFNKHEVILFQVLDGPQELDFNYDSKPYEFIDMETQTSIKIQPSQFKTAYQEKIKTWENTLTERCRQYQIDLISVDMRDDVGKVLNKFLLRRNKLL